ncbi:MAG: 50S ribosomal protein L22 [Candidatus Shapirobacteria bacterium]|nr:50S ribosomal protein L22 [Candidatus Shapirobacteria bacterium]
MVQIRAEGKHLPISPRKLRLVAEIIRGRTLSEALSLLDHLPQKGARILKKTVNSAAANAVNNLNLDRDNLFISQVIVNDGARFKRLDYSHGARFNGGMIQRRLSHLRVILEEQSQKSPSAKPTSGKKIIKEKDKKKTVEKKLIKKD